MKIKRVSAKGLNGSISIDHDFHEDINIVTGLNGSGKTTLLKAIWYLISGNAERIAPEIIFSSIKVETESYEVLIEMKGSHVEWAFQANEHDLEKGKYRNKKDEGVPSRAGAEKLNNLLRSFQISSLYFPTFRRIEGGYSMTHPRYVRKAGEAIDFYRRFYRDGIQDELESLASQISVDNNRFVCSISTNDIVSLLTRRYARVSETLNDKHKDFSAFIIQAIQDAKPRMQENGSDAAAALLNEMKQRADGIEKERNRLLHPFNVLSELTKELFRHRGIRVQAVTLGQSVDAIDSAVLSAGEKQMLSFLCYNAFSENSIVFIDEPELSLHPDWQRKLFGILMKQQPTNQFIVATHSPFIYTKYEDKEIAMSEDRGG